jgi:uncharacterized protein YgfB (UPF0149 family)
MASAKFGQSFSAGAKAQYYITIERLKEYVKDICEEAYCADDPDPLIARAEAVADCIDFLEGWGVQHE